MPVKSGVNDNYGSQSFINRGRAVLKLENQISAPSKRGDAKMSTEIRDFGEISPAGGTAEISPAGGRVVVVHRSGQTVEQMPYAEAVAIEHINVNDFVAAQGSSVTGIKNDLQDRREALTIAIVIPTINSHAYLADSVRRIAAQIDLVKQTHPYWTIELIIAVNGANQERTLQAAREIQQSAVLNSGSIAVLKLDLAGKVNAMNAAAQYVRRQGSDVIGFIDDDVRFEDKPAGRNNSAFVKSVEYLVNTKDVLMTGPHLLAMKSRGLIPRLEYKYRQRRSTMSVGYPLGAAFFVLTKLYSALPSHVLAEDVALRRYYSDPVGSTVRVQVTDGAYVFYQESQNLWKYWKRRYRVAMSGMQVRDLFKHETHAARKKLPRASFYWVHKYLEGLSFLDKIKEGSNLVLLLILWSPVTIWVRLTVAYRKFLGKYPYGTKYHSDPATKAWNSGSTGGASWLPFVFYKKYIAWWLETLGLFVLIWLGIGEEYIVSGLNPYFKALVMGVGYSQVFFILHIFNLDAWTSAEVPFLTKKKIPIGFLLGLAYLVPSLYFPLLMFIFYKVARTTMMHKGLQSSRHYGQGIERKEFFQFTDRYGQDEEMFFDNLRGELKDENLQDPALMATSAWLIVKRILWGNRLFVESVIDLIKAESLEGKFVEILARFFKAEHIRIKRTMMIEMLGELGARGSREAVKALIAITEDKKTDRDDFIAAEMALTRLPESVKKATGLDRRIAERILKRMRSVMQEEPKPKDPTDQDPPSSGDAKMTTGKDDSQDQRQETQDFSVQSPVSGLVSVFANKMWFKVVSLILSITLLGLINFKFIVPHVKDLPFWPKLFVNSAIFMIFTSDLDFFAQRMTKEGVIAKQVRRVIPTGFVMGIISVFSMLYFNAVAPLTKTISWSTLQSAIVGVATYMFGTYFIVALLKGKKWSDLKETIIFVVKWSTVLALLTWPLVIFTTSATNPFVYAIVNTLRIIGLMSTVRLRSALYSYEVEKVRKNEGQDKQAEAYWLTRGHSVLRSAGVVILATQPEGVLLNILGIALIVTAEVLDSFSTQYFSGFYNWATNKAGFIKRNPKTMKDKEYLMFWGIWFLGIWGSIKLILWTLQWGWKKLTGRKINAIETMAPAVAVKKGKRLDTSSDQDSTGSGDAKMSTEISDLDKSDAANDLASTFARLEKTSFTAAHPRPSNITVVDLERLMGFASYQYGLGESRDPELGHVLQVGVGQLLLARIAADEKIAFYSTGYSYCTACAILAKQRDEMVVGHAHILPDSAWEMHQRVFKYLVRYAGLKDIKIVLGLNSRKIVNVDGRIHLESVTEKDLGTLKKAADDLGMHFVTAIVRIDQGPSGQTLDQRFTAMADSLTTKEYAALRHYQYGIPNHPPSPDEKYHSVKFALLLAAQDAQAQNNIDDRAVPAAEMKPKPTGDAKMSVEVTDTAETKKPRILVVDDEEGIRYGLQRILSRDYDVVTAKDGQEAWEIITSGKYNLDLVFSDVDMPPQLSTKKEVAGTALPLSETQGELGHRGSQE